MGTAEWVGNGSDVTAASSVDAARAKIFIRKMESGIKSQLALEARTRGTSRKNKGISTTCSYSNDICWEILLCIRNRFDFSSYSVDRLLPHQKCGASDLSRQVKWHLRNSRRGQHLANSHAKTCGILPASLSRYATTALQHKRGAFSALTRTIRLLIVHAFVRGHYNSRIASQDLPAKERDEKQLNIIS